LQLITGLAEGLLASIPIIIEAMPEIIDSIIDFIINSIPQIIQTGIQLLTSLITALPQIITTILTAIPKIIDSLVTDLLNSIPEIVDTGVELLISLIENLPQIISIIVTAVPQIVGQLVNTFAANVGLIIAAGVKLFIALIENLPKIIVEIVKAVPQIIAALVSAFSEGVSQMSNVGANLVRGLWSGIQSLAGWLWNKVSAWISSIWDGICNFFGIRSPSREMAWVGEMLVKGLSGSIEDNGDDAVKAAEAMAGDINDVMHGLAADLSTSLPSDINVNGSVGAAGIAPATAAQTVINIYPQTLDEATIDYLFVKFNARLGAAL